MGGRSPDPSPKPKTQSQTQDPSPTPTVAPAQVRPNVDWNRAHAVEWLVSSVVEQVRGARTLCYLLLPYSLTDILTCGLAPLLPY